MPAKPAAPATRAAAKPPAPGKPAPEIAKVERPRMDELSNLPLEMLTPKGTWLPLMVMSRSSKKKQAQGYRGAEEWETKYSSYLQVAHRLVWFREEHPQGSIDTNMELHDKTDRLCLFRARIYDAAGKLLASAVKQETAKDFGDYIEKAETGSVGRALAMCGFGTQFAPELDEEHRIVDSPTNNASNEQAAADALKQRASDKERVKSGAEEPSPMERHTYDAILGLAMAKLGFVIDASDRTASGVKLRDMIAKSMDIELKPLKLWTERDALAIRDHLIGLRDWPDLGPDDDGGGGGNLPGRDEIREARQNPDASNVNAQVAAKPDAAPPSQGATRSATEQRAKPMDPAQVLKNEKDLIAAAVIGGYFNSETRSIRLSDELRKILGTNKAEYPVNALAHTENVRPMVDAMEAGL